VTVRHAVTGPRRDLVRSKRYGLGKERRVYLATVCGLWVDAEHCDEDLRATCDHCRAHFARRDTWPNYLKAAP
jgi:hypothetical protein